MEYKCAGVVCFGIMEFVKRMKIEYCSDTLMYAKKYLDKNLHMKYGKGVMCVRVREFQACIVVLSKNVNDSEERSYGVWIVTAMPNPKRFS